MKWNDCNILPIPKKDVLLTFKSHFGQAFTIGCWDEEKASWYVVVEEDGTMDKISEIKPEKWAYFDEPDENDATKSLLEYAEKNGRSLDVHIINFPTEQSTSFNPEAS